MVDRYKSYDYLFKVCINICLTSFTFGYGNGNFNSIAFDDIVDIYGLHDYPRASTQGFLTGCLSVMGGIGAFSSSYLLRKLSRKKSVQFLAWISLTSGLILIIPHFGFLIVGRLMQGLCIGMCSTVAPLYLRQICPLEIAASLCPYNQIFIVFGITSSFVLSFLLSLFLPPQFYWRLVFGFPIVISCIQLYNLKVNYPYETPKYLVLQRKFDEAKELLGVIYYPEYVNIVFTEIRQAVGQAEGRETIYSSSEKEITIVTPQKEKQIQIELLQKSTEKKEFQSFQKQEKEKKTLFQKKVTNNKLAVFLSFHLSIQQQMVGMGSIIAYSGEIVGSFMPSFQKIFPIFINVMALVGCLASIPLVKYLGRKKNLEYGALSISVSLLILAYILSGYDFNDPKGNPAKDSYLVMLLFISIRVLFSLSTGPIVFLYLSEIVQPNILAASIMVNWLTVATLNIIFPILVALAGGNPAPVYMIFGVYTFFGFLINNRLLIETAGKTEYQIRQQFDEKCK